MVWLFIACAMLVVRAWAGYQPGDVVFSADFHSEDSLKGWSSADWAQIVPGGYDGNNALSISVPLNTSGSPQTRMISTPINMTDIAGYTILVTVLLKAVDVSKPTQPYNGVKVMLHYSGKSGEQDWENALGVYGTFDWNSTNYMYSAFIYNDVDYGSLSVGLQDSTGTVLFDSVNITVFRVPRPPLPTPPVNPPPPYNGHPQVPRFRGVMSPQTYIDSDIQNLGQNWKANLMRWQLVWSGASEDDRKNLTLYDQWLRAKLDETDLLLAACVKYGIKVVVDLHAPPGGRDPTYGDLFLIDQVYQTHFLEVWHNISTRYKGNEAVWGYDIDNEPLQNLPGNPGVLQWNQLAQVTTQLIRAIDPNVTLIVECEDGGSPPGYDLLLPVTDDKVVYEVHMYEPAQFTGQGVFPGLNLGLVYPGEIGGVYYNITTLQSLFQPVRDFQLAYNVQIYVGEFSAVRWATNGTAVNYIRDCITIFEEWGWDWSYHAYREWQGWSVEYDENINDDFPVNYTTTRKALLLSWFDKNVYPYPPYADISQLLYGGDNKITIS